MPSVVAPADGGVVARRDLPWWGWLIAAALAYSIAMLTLLITATGASIAPWWPAAGFTMILLLLAPRRQLWIVLAIVVIITFAANITIGRSLIISVLYTLANTLEMAVIGGILGLHRRPFHLDSMRAAVRFLAAVIVGGIVLGNLAGLVSWGFAGTDFVPIAVTAAASHIAAILLIAPFGALPPKVATRSRIPVPEAVLQTGLLIGALIVTFRPGAELPLSFLVFTLLGWGLLRLPVTLAYLQALIAALVVLVLTRADPTSFGSQTMPIREVVLTTVVFLATIGVFAVLLVTARYEIERAHARTLQVTQGELDTERERGDVLRMKLELDRQREDFVATTSHELRTPITSIAGYTELLSESDGLGDREREWVGVIDRNTARLTELVEDLLALGRASSPLPARAVQALVTRDLIADAIATHRPTAAAKTIALTASGHETSLLGNPSDVRRALANLVSNAVKFTPDGGSVEIMVTRRDDTVAVTVTDSGPGMTADTVAHAFERFYRGVDAELLSTPGTGLGLSIVRELIERNGGTVWLEHAGHGGLRAGFALPAAP
ncbi:ATP-binding protein [Microbacterium sp. W1N]|uniref:sensor histidine kinase n=1 Tax=Microbacterium festucae TaxID=2977531 RepID=UPI0021BF6976|nr:sensor histidine kinase [Microbacterium festucae]MCT9819048.1 ATP-binding protein [Microbacterium festucae]